MSDRPTEAGTVSLTGTADPVGTADVLTAIRPPAIPGAPPTVDRARPARALGKAWRGFVRYFFPLLTVTLALVTKEALAMQPGVGGTGFHLLFAAVAAAAWFGGFIPGLIATLLGAVVETFAVLPPVGTLAVTGTASQVEVILFLVEGTLISALTAGLRSARSRAVTAREAAEDHMTSRETVEAELRASRDQLDAILRGVADGITVQEPDGRLIYANDAAARIIGFETAEALLAAPTSAVVGRFDVLDEDGDPFPLDKLPGRIALQGKPGPETLLRFRERGSGDERWSLTQSTPVFDDSGHVLFAVNIFREVTADQKARAARDAFIGVLSHELRTPITTIYGGAEVLATRPTLAAETRREITEDIQTEARRLQRLIEDLLVLTKDERDALVVGREPVLLHHLIADVVRDEAERSPGVRFAPFDAAPLPLVRGEPVYVEQALRNLVGNAAKYSPAGGTVAIRTEVTDTEVAVSVLDDGPGFPAEEADRLFGLFYRAPGTSKQVPGAGIGLFVSRRLVEAMDGRMWARRRPEGGSDFGFALPILAADDEVD
jgi:PAS domain S-box-containing protein